MVEEFDRRISCRTVLTNRILMSDLLNSVVVYDNLDSESDLVKPLAFVQFS